MRVDGRGESCVLDLVVYSRVTLVFVSDMYTKSGVYPISFLLFEMIAVDAIRHGVLILFRDFSLPS